MMRASQRDEKGDDSDKQIVEVLGVGVGLGRGGHRAHLMFRETHVAP